MNANIEENITEALINASPNFLDHSEIHPILDLIGAAFYEIEDLGEVEIDCENGTYYVGATFTVVPVDGDGEDFESANYEDAVSISVTARVEPDGKLTDFSFV